MEKSPDVGDGLSGCSNKDKEPKENDPQQTEVPAMDSLAVVKYNEALFDSCRSDIKFALAFVENYYPYIYWCGERWTTGHGLTVLYNSDGTYKNVTQKTQVPTIDESDVYKGRYLNFEVLPSIKKRIKVPIDKNTLVSACVLRYCIGGKAFKDSKFVAYVNAGKSGPELAKTLTRYRVQQGVLKRCYFFAALLNGKIQYSDLLDLRAEGCYSLETYEVVVCKKDENGKYIKRLNKYGSWEYVPEVDKDGFCIWIFKDLDKKLQKAKEPRNSTLSLEKKKHGKKVSVPCQLVKDVVPDYVWQDVTENGKLVKKNTVSIFDDYFAMFDQIRKQYSCDAQNDTSYIAYQNGDYAKALEAGKLALQLANTNKQYGAANFNIGITYSAMGKYDSAVHHLEQSLAYNERPATKDSLAAAQQKLAEQQANAPVKKRGRGIATGFVLGAGIVGGAMYARKKYRAQRHR